MIEHRREGNTIRSVLHFECHSAVDNQDQVVRAMAQHERQIRNNLYGILETKLHRFMDHLMATAPSSVDASRYSGDLDDILESISTNPKESVTISVEEYEEMHRCLEEMNESI